MFGLSAGHLLILGVVVLLFGSRRIPELGRSLGQGVKAFKDGIEGQTTVTDLKAVQLPDKSSDSTT